ncbi:RHS repeat-associated core domain-containing protein [Catenulispora yoronensis]|uniref:RHS repeat-associated core domain-containing protein n=1 Tax=Catenulispora yoronensis TaxID=450799 RepID=A0ABP5F7Z7_9ACTN
MLTVALAVSVVDPPSSSAATVKGKRPSTQVEKPVPGTTLATRAVTHLGSLPTAAPTAPVSRIAAGTATVTVPRAAAKTALRSAGSPGSDNAAQAGSTQADSIQAGSLPIRLGAPADGRATAADQVSVTVADPAAAQAAGVNGLMFSLTPAGTSDGSVSVGVDTSALASMFGGDFGSRLHLVQLPACALTTPDIAACRIQTPVAGQVAAPSAHALTADVSLASPATPAAPAAPASTATPASATPASAAPTSDSSASPPRTARTAALAASSAAPVVLAATGDASGSTGSFTATSLSPSSQWESGSSSGDFTWSYSIDTPKPFAGEAPTVGLAYDSGSVDGRTDSTNNQTSPIGEGFDLGAGGFIERSYKSCSDFTDLPKAQQTGDQCWAGQVLNISLGGKSSALVWDPVTGQVHPADDNGERIQLLTNASNGVYNGEYWKVTTTDGTQYYFGRDHGPGFTNQTHTNSAWTVPVYGAHSGDPCYNATFKDASCQQAWRWNLDYVEDMHGNVTMYYYTPETNYYVPNNAANGTTSVKYTRGGVLDHIEYGLRDDNGTVYANPAVDKVVFTPAERCIPNENGNGFSCDPSQFTAANAIHWHDVPQDQNCDQGATCSNYAPTFWSRKRITTITTQVYSGGTYLNADVYKLTQSYPDTGDGTPFALALATIQHCGSDGTTCTPAVSFLGQMMANRVPVSGQAPGYLPAVKKWRLSEVDTETGEQIQAVYNTPACSPSNLPASDETNGLDCFPEYWVPLGATDPIKSYFYHYTVKQITETDPTGGAPNKVTGYTYLGPAAWHFDDSELSKASQRTYSEFRGYGKVQTRVGINPTTLTETLYFRGMDGDTLSSGKRSVQISDTENDESVADANALAGSVFESDVYTADGGTIDHATVSDYTVSAPVATRNRTGLNPLVAVMTSVTRQRSRQALAAGGWARTVTSTAYNNLGMPTQVDDQGDGSSPHCSRTSYVTNSTAWLTLVSRLTETAEVCPSGNQNGTLISDTKTSYDNQAWGAAPTVGNPTSVATASGTTGGVAGITAYVTAAAGFDPYGRRTSKTDVMGRASATAYTPATLGPVTQVVETTLTATDPLSRSSTTVMEPLRGLTTATIDVAGLRNDATFDALGRLTQAWIPGRSKSGGQTPNTIYTYSVSNTGPSVVTTQSLADDNSYVVQEVLYDALLRQRQTQNDAEGGGRIIGDTVYDNHGWVIKTNHSYFATGAPATSIYNVGDSAVPDQTITTFDGQGRSVKDTEYHDANATWETATVYGGDRTTVIPPAGGTATTTITDVRGNNREVDQYLSAPTVTGNTVTGQINGAGTKYAYDPAGNLARVTDPTGTNTWTYTYDLRGRKTAQTDPDTGQTTYTYDDDGEMLTSTDSRGKVLAYKYDNLGRKLGEYVGTTSGTAIARWTYDTLMKGKPTAAAGYMNGKAYITSTTGYNNAGLATGVRTDIPSGEGALSGSYTTSYGYTPVTNKIQTVTEPAAGPFASETVTTTYTRLSNPATTTGNNYYVSATTYSPYGEALQYTQGPSSNPVWQTYAFDDQTHRETEVRIDQQAAPPTIDKIDYSYNTGGQITKISDLRQGLNNDTQCFRYDGLSQLTQAWSATDSCAADPSAAGNGTVGSAAAAPYWTNWTYDVAGNRKQQTQHAVPGATGGDTVTNYTYNTGQPHTLAGTATTGPGAGTASYGYDPAGNTTGRTTPATGAQTLNWDEGNRLTSITAGAKVTNYVYDADGNQMMRKDPGKTTLFIGDTELVLDTVAGTVSGTRYYKHGDDVVAAVDSGTGHLSYLMPDHQGSSDVSVDATTSAATFRSYTPYGGTRGAAPAAWPGQRGWLGVGTADSSTGLTTIGAREYEPDTGRFISRDPVFSSDGAQNIGGYTYSGNDPVNKTDPTGLFWGSSWIKKHAKAIVAVTVVVAVVTVAVVAAPVAVAAGMAALNAAAGAAATATTIGEIAIPAAVAAGGVVVSASAEAAGAGAIATGVAIAGRAATAFAGGGDGTEDYGTSRSGGGGCHSFSGDTKVLMADGTKEPIADVKVGDQVANAEPGGGVEGHRVEVVHETPDDKDFTDLTVRTEHGPETITGTQNHPYYDVTTGEFTDASKLKPGDELQTADGTVVTVVSVRNYTSAMVTHDLTVDGLHTYFVVAGDVAVLVHNTMCPTKAALLAGPHPDDVAYPAKDKPSRTSSYAHDSTTFTQSGWDSSYPQGYSRSSPVDTYTAHGSSYTQVPRYKDNNAGDGAFHLSHAEPQLAALQPGASQSVDREMCDVCVMNMGPYAKHIGMPTIVSDPVFIHVFNSDGVYQTHDYPSWFRGHWRALLD